MADSNINIEITEATPISLEIVEDTPVQLEITATGPAGVVQSIVAGTNVTVNSTDPANPIVSATGGGGGGNMQIGEPVVDALPRRALFTDDNGDLTDDVMKSKDISFFGGALTGKAVKPVNFVHDDSMLLGGIDATSFGGTETFGVLQSIDRSGSFAYTKVDFANLDTVPPETLFLIGYDAGTGKSQMVYYPNGILSNPSPMFTIDETGVSLSGSQKIAAVVTNFDSPLDTNIPTALATRTQMMSLLGTYSYGSDSINFYGGASNVPFGDYTPYNGDLLRIRTAGSKDFGFGLVYGQIGDFIYYDDDEWKPLFNPKRVANATSNSLLATGSATNNEIQTLDTATCPSLTEVAYVKGVTSAIQTQITAKMTDSMATNKLLGRGTAGTGAIEEITLGTGLSLTGTTLNSSGGGGSGDVVGPTSSVDSEVVLFNSNTGKLIKAATITGLAKLTAGVLSAATVGTDYLTGSSSNALTNKTIDANGTGNSITNLETADFATNVVDTDGTLSANSDTRLSSQKAIVTYAQKRTPRGTSKYDGASVRDYCIPGASYLSGVSASAPSTNRWVFEPYVITEPTTFDRVALEITTAGAAGKLARLSIYTADQYWQPATLVQDFGTIAVDPGAVPTVTSITINLTLQPGRYLGVWITDGAATYRQITSYFQGGGINSAGSTTPLRYSFQSLNGSGTVASGFAAVNPKWERDLYSSVGTFSYYIRWREAV